MRKNINEAQREFDKVVRPARADYYKSNRISRAICALECADAKAVFLKILFKANAEFDKAMLKDGK